jgi:hypothetical protein
MLVDQHKQIGILREATSYQLISGFNKQDEIFEKSQELNGQSEICKNQYRFLA